MRGEPPGIETTNEEESDQCIIIALHATAERCIAGNAKGAIAYADITAKSHASSERDLPYRSNT